MKNGNKKKSQNDVSDFNPEDDEDDDDDFGMKLEKLNNEKSKLKFGAKRRIFKRTKIPFL